METGTVKVIYLLFSIYETFGQLNLHESKALESANLLPSTTSDKVSDVLRDILNQESIVRFSMVQKIQSLVLDVTDGKNDIEYLKKKLSEVTKELQTLKVKNRQMEDENAKMHQELETLGDHNNRAIETTKSLSEKEILFLKNQTSRLQKENEEITLDTIEIKEQLRVFNETFDFLKYTNVELRKEFRQKIQGLQVDFENNENNTAALKRKLGNIENLMNKKIQNLNESKIHILENQTTSLKSENQKLTTENKEIKSQLVVLNETIGILSSKCDAVNNETFAMKQKYQNALEKNIVIQQQLDVFNETLDNLRKTDEFSSKRLHIVEDNLQNFSVLLDNIRVAQNASNAQLLKTSAQFPSTLPKNCKKLHDMGIRISGVYSIYPWDDPHKNSVQVYCDMVTAGGGWTVIQNRVDGKVNFNRNWQEYKAGFGGVSTSYWIGNDVIHQLSKENSSSLYVSIIDKNGTSLFIQYDTFSISGEDDHYRLYIGGNATGTLEDRVRYGTGGNNINGMKFSTSEKDNDLRSDHCTDVMGEGGWWFNSCSDAYLNGEYPPGKWEQPWYPKLPKGSHITSTRMMIRRK